MIKMSRVRVLIFILVAATLISLIYLYGPHVAIVNYDSPETIPKIYLFNNINYFTPVNNDQYDINKTCSSPHKNIVFVKTHKTGTSTTVNILYNFGIHHGLNFAIYPYSHQLFAIQPNRLMKLKRNETYNIMCQHMIFNKERIESVMPPDSYYFSLVRDPIRAFISFFIFYGSDNRMRNGQDISLDESINRFLDLKIAEQYVPPNTFLVTNNLNSMSFDLGMSNARSELVAREDIDKHIAMLSARFNLMMTLEHLDESLLLLKQDLCWEDSDVFYLNRMISRSNRSHEAVAESTLTRLRELLTPDVRVYEHFSRKLLERLDGVPPGFQDKLREATEARSEFESRCMRMDKYKEDLYNTKRHPLTEFGNNNLHCSILAEHDTILTKLVSRLQDPNYKQLPRVPSFGYIPKYRTFPKYPRQWKLYQ